MKYLGKDKYGFVYKLNESDNYVYQFYPDNYWELWKRGLYNTIKPGQINGYIASLAVWDNAIHNILV